MCIAHKETTEMNKVENHKKNGIVQDTKELTRYVGVNWVVDSQWFVGRRTR